MCYETIHHLHVLIFLKFIFKIYKKRYRASLCRCTGTMLWKVPTVRCCMMQKTANHFNGWICLLPVSCFFMRVNWWLRIGCQAYFVLRKLHSPWTLLWDKRYDACFTSLRAQWWIPCFSHKTAQIAVRWGHMTSVFSCLLTILCEMQNDFGCTFSSSNDRWNFCRIKSTIARIYNSLVRAAVEAKPLFAASALINCVASAILSWSRVFYWFTAELFIPQSLSN